MTLNLNKQAMFYSNYLGKTAIYQRDTDGNIIYYTEDDGTRIPLTTGETVDWYSEPIKFFANINNKLNAAVWQDYGLDVSTTDLQLLTAKNELPLKLGSRIWKKSEVKYTDEWNTNVDEDSADYIVKGVADEGLDYDLFLLQRIVK